MIGGFVSEKSYLFIARHICSDTFFCCPFYVGSDTACFYSSPATTCSEVSTTTGIGFDLQGDPLLTYTPQGFSASASGGTVALGLFSVAPTFGGFEDGTFDLDVTFTAPGGGGNSYTAQTAGIVFLTAGGAEVSFDQPTTEVYSYPGGSFELSLPTSPILIGNGQTVALDAVITSLASVPEPATLPIMAFGLLVIGFVMYRRRSANSLS